MCVRAAELKEDYRFFKLMRGEKVVAKRLGRIRYKEEDLSPFTKEEDHAMIQLIKDTAALKEAAFARTTERWNTLYREILLKRDSNRRDLHLWSRFGVGPRRRCRLSEACCFSSARRAAPPRCLYS